MKITRLMHKPVVLFLLISFLVGGCMPKTPIPKSTDNPGNVLVSSKLVRIANPQITQSDQEQLSAGNRAFAADLYQQLRSAPGNLFFSPYSISLALAMTYAGAQGATAQQMAQALHFTLPPEQLHPAFNALDQYLAALGQSSESTEPTPTDNNGQGFQLNIANSIWGQKDFNFLAAYLDLLAQNYGVGLRLVDFVSAPETTRKVINDWVSQQTKDKIKDLFPEGSLDSDTRLALVNAIYFKGSWLSEFKQANTQEGIFHLLDGGQVTISMMHSGAAAQRYVRAEDYQAVELPYSGYQTAMVVVMPDEGKFEAFEKRLSSELLEDILSGLGYFDITLTMPKFKIESSFDLSDTLAKMGMPVAFDRDQADFSGMDGQRDLFISNVQHKAYVMVDEKGAEAAAGTGVAIKPVSIMEQRVVVVDRPFLFFIYDRTSGTVLFIGRILNPAQ